MQMQRIWTIRLVTLLLWLLALGSAVYWALKFVGMTAAPAYAVVVGAAPSTMLRAADSTAVARALGGGLVPANSAASSPASGAASGITASRFVLTGIVDGKSPQADIALIAIDGKPAKPYRLGGVLEAGVVLQSVSGRKAVIGPADGAAGVGLELPPQVAALSLGVAVPPRTQTPLASPSMSPQSAQALTGPAAFPPIVSTPPMPSAPLAPPTVIAPAANGALKPGMAGPSAGDVAAAETARAAAASSQSEGRLGAIRQRSASGLGKELGGAVPQAPASQ